MSNDDVDIPTVAGAGLQRSRDVDQALGFVVAGGDAEADYLMLEDGESTIGLFHGMFDRNILTSTRA